MNFFLSHRLVIDKCVLHLFIRCRCVQIPHADRLSNLVPYPLPKPAPLHPRLYLFIRCRCVLDSPCSQSQLSNLAPYPQVYTYSSDTGVSLIPQAIKSSTISPPQTCTPTPQVYTCSSEAGVSRIRHADSLSNLAPYPLPKPAPLPPSIPVHQRQVCPGFLVLTSTTNSPNLHPYPSLYLFIRGRCVQDVLTGYHIYQQIPLPKPAPLPPSIPVHQRQVCPRFSVLKGYHIYHQTPSLNLHPYPIYTCSSRAGVSRILCADRLSHLPPNPLPKPAPLPPSICVHQRQVCAGFSVLTGYHIYHQTPSPNLHPYPHVYTCSSEAGVSRIFIKVSLC